MSRAFSASSPDSFCLSRFGTAGSGSLRRVCRPMGLLSLTLRNPRRQVGQVLLMLQQFRTRSVPKRYHLTDGQGLPERSNSKQPIRLPPWKPLVKGYKFVQLHGQRAIQVHAVENIVNRCHLDHRCNIAVHWDNDLVAPDFLPQQPQGDKCWPSWPEGLQAYMQPSCAANGA